MRTIRAAEIGTYLYCQRAWQYARRGEVSEHQREMTAGREMHYRHGQAALMMGCLQIAAYALLLLGLGLLVAHFTFQWLS